MILKFPVMVKNVQVLSNVISYIPRSRYFCTVECSLVQLSADIYFLYKDLTENLSFSMSRYRLAVFKNQIDSGRSLRNFSGIPTDPCS